MNPSPPIAISGSLVDAKNVAAHKSFRLIIDVPAEQAKEVIDAFGWPTMVSPVPVAVARLNAAPRELPAEPDDDHLRSYAQQAGIVCQQPGFWRFLVEDGRISKCSNGEDAAIWLREWCGVDSRSQLLAGSVGAQRFRSVKADYDLWLKDVRA